MKPAVCEMLYGLGNAATDPVTGEPLLAQKIRALGVTVPPIYGYDQAAAVARAILALPTETLVFLCAISCGANGLARIIAMVAPRKLSGVYMIAPSIYCNTGCPPIGDNAPNVHVFNGPWYMSLPPGLSSYAPQRIAGSKQPAIVRHWSPTWHPCDSDVPNVQAPILANIARVRA